MKKKMFGIAMTLVLLLVAAKVLAASSEAFQRGIAAFEAGHYHQALHEFLRAQSEGNHSTQLQYNLGVTYYWLGEYNDARAIFESLARHRQVAPLAHYNLGLIALKTGERSRARSEFQAAHATATNPRLRRLAAEQLARLGASAGPAAFIGFLNAGVGYDDNVALASSVSLIPPSQRGSPLISLLAGGIGQLSGDYRNGWQFSGTFFRVAYPRISTLSLNYLRAGPQYRARYGSVQTQIGAYGGYLTLGGNTFETLGSFAAQANSDFTPHQRLRALYQYDRIQGGGGFGYLSGWRQSLKIEYGWERGPASLSAGYRLELNRRNDLTRGQEFFSVSPTRNEAFLDGGWRFGDRTRGSAGISYENSVYNNPNRTLQGTTLISATRTDHELTARVALTRTLGRGLKLVGEYRLLRNQSNFPLYQYLSHRYELRLEYLFY